MSSSASAFSVSAQVGTALGLAVLVPLSVARTDALTQELSDPSGTALVEGFRWAFFGAAGIAVSGALFALFLIRERKS